MSPGPAKKQIRIYSELIQKLKSMKTQMNFNTYEEVIWFLFSNREVWIGHIQGNEKKWILSWSEDLDDVEQLIEDIEGPMEENSWQKIMEQGFIKFNVENIPRDRLVFNDDQIGIENNEIKEWIKELMEYPVGEPDEDPDYVKNLSFDDYKKMISEIPACPKCGKRRYEQDIGCEECSFKE